MRKAIKTGAIIFDSTFRYLLVVRGRRSLKWGPPKGHLNPGETLISGAFREVAEETGLFFKFPPGFEILPRVVIENVRLFLVAIPYHSRINIVDRQEILDIDWLDLNNPNLFHTLPMTKVLSRLLQRINYIRQVVRSNSANYDDQVSNHFRLNEALKNQIDLTGYLSETQLSLYHPHDLNKFTWAS